MELLERVGAQVGAGRPDAARDGSDLASGPDRPLRLRRGGRPPGRLRRHPTGRAPRAGRAWAHAGPARPAGGDGRRRGCGLRRGAELPLRLRRGPGPDGGARRRPPPRAHPHPEPARRHQPVPADLDPAGAVRRRRPATPAGGTTTWPCSRPARCSARRSRASPAPRPSAAGRPSDGGPRGHGPMRSATSRGSSPRCSTGAWRRAGLGLPRRARGLDARGRPGRPGRAHGGAGAGATGGRDARPGTPVAARRSCCPGPTSSSATPASCTPRW